jgi:glycosyltransferase involved in cell wall biosynthesis
MLSICVPLKNRSRVMADGHELRLFPNCVRSIATSLDETISAELVVADWNSDDWPLDEWLQREAGELPVRVIPMEGDFSRGRGRNAAAAAAQGDILLFLDADCLLCAAVVRLGINHLRQDKAFFPVVYCFDGPDHRSGWWEHFGFGNCMVTREIYRKAGGWPIYQIWGLEDDHFFDRVRAVADVVREAAPGFYHQWHPTDILWKDRYADRDPAAIEEIKQSRVAMGELAAVVPVGCTIVLVDEARFGIEEITGRPVRPFLEVNGDYAGPPPDDATAIRELERLRTEGASFLVFAWMAYWWLEHYAGFGRYLDATFRRVLQNDRIIVFDLRRSQ